MKISKKRGISLIVLVITVIVIMILAGAVILSLINNNPISQAAKAVYLSDVRNFQAELDLYESKEFLDKLGGYNPILLQADEASVTYNDVVDTSRTMNDLIPTLGKTVKYAGQFQVIDGKLVFQGSDTNKQDWTKETGGTVVIAGEPRVSIVPQSETAAVPGTDIVYTIKFSSNAPLTTIDLTDKIEVIDNNEVALLVQPVINVGTISGTSANVIRYVDVTIKTDTLNIGSYKLKIKSGSVINAESKTNSQDAISLIGFDMLDNIPPVNPTMSANPAGWTNGNVLVTITYSEDSAVKEYSLDGTTWNAYTTPISVSANNTTVYAKGKDASNNESGVATLTVSNIDKVAPTVTASNGGSTTSSITITAVASDEGGSNLNTASYQYSKDNGVTWTSVSNATSYTFSPIVTGTYQCKVKVKDNVGNSTISSAVAITTVALGTVTLEASPTTWTNGNVSVTATYPAEVVTKQYSTNGTTWSTYTTPVIVSANNTTVYAKGLDAGGNQTAQASMKITNIDKVAPTVTASNGGTTTSSITVNATASDSGGSGLVTTSYQYSKDNGVTWTTASNATSYTFNSLTTGTYQCKVKVADNAGNSTTSNAVSITTAALGAVTLVASPTAWTNGDVTVTITYPAAVVTKQYSTNGTTWNTYTAPVVVSTNNTTVYAKGLDAGGNQTAQATLTVANIDKDIPTVAYGTNGGTGTTANTTVTVNDIAGSSLKASTLQYVWDTQNVTTPSSGWTTFTNGATITKTGITGTYYLWVKGADNAGNSIVTKSNVFLFVISITDFAYTGNSQSFTIPYNGTYKLEVWGAQGGSCNMTTYPGGSGGYSAANFNFTAGTVVYVYVGGQGQYNYSTAAFNGGGIGGKGTYYSYGYASGGGGGGATDIRQGGSTLSDRIIVAGGGGGRPTGTGSWESYNGGYGGGANSSGGNGLCENGDGAVSGKGGTLSAGGTGGGNSGTFGIGGNGGGGMYSAGGGGGGGYYGGGSGNNYAAGGGGSGYVNTSLAISGSVSGTSGTRTGNGAAKITLQ